MSRARFHLTLKYAHDFTKMKMYKPRQGPGRRLGTNIEYILIVADTISSAVPQEGKAKVSEKVKYSGQQGSWNKRYCHWVQKLQEFAPMLPCSPLNSYEREQVSILTDIIVLTNFILTERGIVSMDWVTLAQRGDLLRQTGGTCPEYVSSGMSEHLTG
ncbi:hypothetical protein J6590_094532 [Homalodisca vitripennis]|nr:hypothetical protein J6590_094532 [Homalodisca vitripennis]